MLRKLSASLTGLFVVALFALATAQFGEAQNPGLTVSGAVTANHCVKFLNQFQVADAGGNCVAGSVVSSFNGRSGAVSPQLGDYTCATIGASSGCSTDLTIYRTPLTGNTTYYVNGTGGPATCGTTGLLTCGIGNDSTTTPSNPATPFATVNAAISYIAKNIDTKSVLLTINLAHGTSSGYAFACSQNPLLGQITFNIIGDFNAPTAVKALTPNGAVGAAVKDQCVPSLSSYEIDDQGLGVAAIAVGQQGIVDLRSMTFGSWNTGNTLFQVSDGGKLNFVGVDPSGTITNTLAGTTYGPIFDVSTAGIIATQGTTIAIPNALTVSGAFARALSGYLNGFDTTTFTGAGVAGTVGTRCLIQNTGIVIIPSAVDPNSVFPGNANCIPQNGLYVETWQPTLQGSTVAGAPTYAANCGTGAVTCRIGTVLINGKEVIIGFKLSVTALGGATGNLQIGNLPIGAASQGNFSADDLYGCIISSFNGWTASAGFTTLDAQIRGTATWIDLMENGSTKTGIFAPVADFAAATLIQGSCTYRRP